MEAAICQYILPDCFWFTGEDNESKLKKVWGYAVGLNNGDEKLPSIRNMKNDLLAFNEKRKRSKNQNNESF